MKLWLRLDVKYGIYRLTNRISTSAIKQWKAAFTPDAEILFYGCKIVAGESEKALIKQKIGNLTGADVAASTNVTGASDRGDELNKNNGSSYNIHYASPRKLLTIFLPLRHLIKQQKRSIC